MRKDDFDYFLSRLNEGPYKLKELVQHHAYVLFNQSSGRGTIEAATGVGKSRIGVMKVIDQFKKNPDSIVYVLVPTETLRDKEWPDEFKKWGADHLISRTKFLCHASMQDEIVQGEVDLAIWDECHHATIMSGTFFTNNKVWSILGLTATLPKDNPNKMEMLNRLCPSIFQVTLEEATLLKLVSEFEVKILLFELNSVDLNVTVGTEKRPTHTSEASHYKVLTKNVQRSIIAKNENATLYHIQRRTTFLKNLATRTLIAQDIMKVIINPENRTLIFCGSIEQSKILCGDNIYNSKSTTIKLEEFQQGKINYLGAVNALNEGKNIDGLDQILVVCIDSKDRNIIQRIGRSIRYREGYTAMIVILAARGTADEKWMRKAIKDFNPARIREYNIKPESHATKQ